MKQTSCSHEEAVARAASTGNWPEAIARHTEECAICRDVAQTARRMLALARPPEAGDSATISQQSPPLPDPGLVWHRARLDREPATNIETLLEWVQIGCAAAAPLGLGGWVAWNWYSIEAIAGEFLAGAWPQLSTAAYVLSSLTPAALIVAALALGYPFLTSE